MQLVGTPGQHLITYYAEAGTPEHDALVLLDYLGATQKVTSRSDGSDNDDNQPHSQKTRR